MFGMSKERKAIEDDIKAALDAGVDVRVTGRGTLIFGAKNLSKIPEFSAKADRIRGLVKQNHAKHA